LSLILKKEHRLRKFQALRKVFGPMRENLQKDRHNAQRAASAVVATARQILLE